MLGQEGEVAEEDTEASAAALPAKGPGQVLGEQKTSKPSHSLPQPNSQKEDKTGRKKERRKVKEARKFTKEDLQE